MSTDQPYSLRFTRHAVRDLDAMFTYITYELDAAEPAKALMRRLNTPFPTCGSSRTPPRRPATTCWPAKATAR